MKSITQIIIITALIFCVQLQAQNNTIKANGNIITTERTVGEFEKISVSGSFDVTLLKGKEGTINIKASENLMAVIETVVEEGNLKIRFKKGTNIRNSKTIQITVTFENINSVSLAGSGDITSKETIQAENLDLSLSGSGNFNLNVSSTNLNLKIAGSGNMNLSGKTETYNGSISGSGNINTPELTANTVNAKISGSGNIKVNALSEINAKTSGSGNIIYTGNPTIIKANSSGSGSVHQKN